MNDKCCERDTDGDGNCPIHSSPGVLRIMKNQEPTRPKIGENVREHNGAFSKIAALIGPDLHGDYMVWLENDRSIAVRREGENWNERVFNGPKR